MNTFPHSESADWADHVGHRLAVEPAKPTPGGRAGVCIYCQHCGVTLAYRPAAPDPGGEPPVAAGLDPLVGELLDFAAGLRSMLLDSYASGPGRPHELRLDDGTAIAPPDPFDDPYWKGYHDASCTSQQCLLAALCQSLEDVTSRHVPAPDRSSAWRFVRASVADRLRTLRGRLAPAPARRTGRPISSESVKI